MADTAIEWLVDRIVATDVLSGPSQTVKLCEFGGAPTGACHYRIRFILFSAVRALAVVSKVGRNGLYNFQVLWAVVRFVFIYVMYHFTFSQLSPKFLLSNKPVFVHIATRIGKMVSRNAEHDITIRCGGSTAAPIRVPSTAVYLAHFHRVTQRMSCLPK